MNRILATCITAAALTLAACTTPTPTAALPDTPAKIGMANPASVNCQKQGGQLEIRTDKTGGQYGMCALPDGRVCEEWALFRDNVCKSTVDE